MNCGRRQRTSYLNILPLTLVLCNSPSPFILAAHLLSQGRSKVYVGLSFCLTVRDGCSVLWVTKSSCVVDSVFVCVSWREHVQECVRACVNNIQRRVRCCSAGRVCAELFRFHLLMSTFPFQHTASMAKDMLCAIKSYCDNKKQ